MVVCPLLVIVIFNGVFVKARFGRVFGEVLRNEGVVFFVPMVEVGIICSKKQQLCANGDDEEQRSIECLPLEQQQNGNRQKTDFNE